MASVFDVASYILQKQGPMSGLKLQKLVYYSQAWSLAWDEKPIFREEIEAWTNGPVCRALYAAHRLEHTVTLDMIRGNPERLTEDETDTINGVLGFYGDKDAYWLRELTHNEEPWIDARKGVPDNARSANVISHDSMKAYYSSL